METTAPLTAPLAASRYVLVSGWVIERQLPPAFDIPGEAAGSTASDRAVQGCSFGSVTIPPKKHCRFSVTWLAWS